MALGSPGCARTLTRGEALFRHLDAEHLAQVVCAAVALVLDYSFGRDRSDQLLAVRFDPSGEVVAISHES